MKKGFDNGNDLTPIIELRDATGECTTPISKLEIIDHLNQLTDYNDPETLSHPQVYALKDVQKWLTAHERYVALPDEAKTESLTTDDNEPNTRQRLSTAIALEEGVFLDMSQRVIEDNIRLLGSNIFNTDTNNDKEALNFTPYNRAYYEAWISLKERSNSLNEFSGTATNTVMLAKLLFNDAHSATNNDIKRSNLNNALSTALSALDYDGQKPIGNFDTITTTSLIAYTIHDLAVLGEFGDKRESALAMSINLLWDNVESIVSLPPGLIPEEVRGRYVAEMEYFRGKYSEELGISPTERPVAEYAHQAASGNHENTPPNKRVQTLLSRTTLAATLQPVA